MLIFLIQPKTTNHPGGISMPIGFVESKENEEESWIDDLIRHILTCLDQDCERCAHAVAIDFIGFLKAS
tara:strand:+ start:262 stop:468 length:207 start_codon:yes stop_codon:yes gene_type:complete